MFGGSGDNASSGKWKLWTFGAFLATGIGQVCSNLPSYFSIADGITSMWRTSAFAFGLGIGAILERSGHLGNMFSDIAHLFSKRPLWFLIALGSLSNLLLSYFFLYPGMNMLVEAGAGAIAYPIMVCSCLILFELYSIIFLKEKRSFIQILALLFCLAGSVGLCLEG
jgi:multidrug transporter EmrE-like cation transporter